MKKVLIWGVGKYYQANKNLIRKEIEVIGFVDNNKMNQGKKVDGKIVFSPEHISDLFFDFIFILCKQYQEIRRQIMEMNLPESVVIYDVTQIEMLCNLPPAIYYNHSKLEEKKEKILFFSPALSFTGAQNIMLIFIERIKEEYDITVISKGDGVVRERLEELGISIVVSPDFNITNETIKKEIDKANLVIVNTIWLGYLVDNLRNVNKKVLWWLHESAMLSYIDRNCIARCLKADNIFTYAVSNVVIDYVEKECKTPNSIKLFPFGIPEYKNINKAHEKTVFAIIGGLNFIKGQDIFIKAVSMIPEEKRKDSEFWIIGGGRLDEDDKLLADNIPEIIIRGEIDNRNMPSIYSELDVVVCCSREESMSVTIIEAFMNEKNSIVSRRAGIADYITDGLNGFIVENEDIAGFANKMLWIIENKQESANMGKRSRSLYDAYFSLEVFDANIKRVLEEVMRG